MGWADRGFHLDPAHRSALFDYAGNIGPTVWWNGEIIGGWAQRPDGEIVWRLLGDPGRAAGEAVTTEAARLSEWIGDARITPASALHWNESWWHRSRGAQPMPRQPRGPPRRAPGPGRRTAPA